MLGESSKAKVRQPNNVPRHCGILGRARGLPVIAQYRPNHPAAIKGNARQSDFPTAADIT
jgi:hypothetical protein